MLGLLRPPGEVDGDTVDSDTEAVGGLGVARGIADLGALAATMTAAGLPVTVRTTGEPYPVAEEVGLTVYRISQEALTNALKHAGRARAEVHLGYGEDLELTVTDDGRGAAAGLTGPAAPGAGRGTTGMRERAAMLGGTFTAGPRAGGGYQVRATLPCQHDSGPAVPAQRESEQH